MNFEVVANDDKILVWQLESGSAAYLSGYYNTDGQVDNLDKNDFWLINLGSDSTVPE